MKKEKNELMELLYKSKEGKLLKQGDQTRIAKELGVSYNAVRSVITGRYNNTRIFDAIIVRAYANLQEKHKSEDKLKELMNSLNK